MPIPNNNNKETTGLNGALGIMINKGRPLFSSINSSLFAIKAEG